ncbi:MAG: helix-turn-helix domain-containing protein [Candidatus Omnitrophota bacterium]
MDHGTQDKNKYLEEFGKRLKEIRQQLKLLQKDFAASLDVSGSFLSEIEKGKANPGFDVLRKIYLLYHVNLHFLLNGQGDPFIQQAEPASPDLPLTGQEKEKFEELMYYVKNAPVVRYAVYEFFSHYLYKNKGMIEEDMGKHRHYVEEKKQD